MTTAHQYPAARVEDMFGRVNVHQVHKRPDICQADIDVFGGVAAVLEAVAHGRMINELALHLDIPIMWFNDWVKANIEPTRLSQAYTIAAETLMVKAQLVLTVPNGSSHEASQARALAQTFKDLAALLDNQRWGQKKPDSLSGQAVMINLDFGAGAPQQVTVGGTAVDHASRPEAAADIEAAVAHIGHRSFTTALNCTALEPDPLCEET